MDLTAVTGIGPATQSKLEKAGVRSVEELARADPQVLAASAEIPVEKVRSFVAQAREIAARAPAAPAAPAARADTSVQVTVSRAVPVTAPQAPRAAPDRVVLRDRTATASVRAGEGARDGLPILTLRAGEPEAEVTGSVEYDAVVLRERESTALVRLDGDWHADVPIYKERVLDAAVGSTEEIRVAVHEIRERTADANGNGASAPGAKKGFLARLLKK